MNVKTVTKTFSKKVDLGNYSSVEIGMTVWADINGEDLNKANHDLWNYVVNNVHTQVADFTKTEYPQALVFTNGSEEAVTVNIKTVSVSMKRTLKTDPKDYGMLKAEDGCWADIEEMEDVNICVRELFMMVRENVKSQLAPHIKTMQKQAKEFYLGLPVITEEEIGTDNG